MFDDLYTRLTSKVNYKLLIFIPPAISLLMVVLLLFRGIPLGIDFQGGTWMDIITDKKLSETDLANLEAELQGYGLTDVRVYIGWDIDTRKNKLTVITTSIVQTEDIRGIISPYTGKLFESDIATVKLKDRPPVELREKLTTRFKERVSTDYDDGTLTIVAMQLNEEELESALNFYLDEDLQVSLEKKNYNVRTVGPTLGETFKNQGIKALLMAFVLMAVVIFLAFRDIIPSIAVLQAAICDALITLGAMSILGIPLEPASLAALLMLIGYSVDSDILLTARVLKQRNGDVNERIDNAMKTGLTMTGTTIAVMVVIIIVSSTLTQIATLQSIGSVLLLGLLADLMTTWFTNAGIIKWYVESPRGRRFRLR